MVDARAEGATVFPPSNVIQALRLTQTLDFTAAVIETQLCTENAEPVCDALSQYQVPFIFYTTCSDRLSSRWSAFGAIRKQTSSR
jgi:hypothetical protein